MLMPFSLRCGGVRECDCETQKDPIQMSRVMIAQAMTATRNRNRQAFFKGSSLGDMLGCGSFLILLAGVIIHGVWVIFKSIL